MKKLHLGCGNKHINGFINIDARDLPNVDIVEDVKTLNSFDDNSIDLIYASHILEHITRVEYTDVLTKWYNLLKSDGILRIAVPDIEKVFQHYQNNGDLRQLRGFLWGGQSHGFNYHYCGWDFKTLEEDLLKIGFSEIKRYEWRETEHSDIDDFSQCYLPHMDKENGMLMSLNIEAKK
jgi:ubiquinone/menaquinone biosynthesis C-methylase UbiE